MFKRRVEDSGKSTVGSFAFKIFFIHIINVPIMYVLAALLGNLNSIGIKLSYDFIYVLVTAVCFIFYVIFVYIEAWRTGERDHNLVLYDRIKYDKYKALYASLVSQIPGFILALLMQLPIDNSGFQKFARNFYLNFIYPIMYFENNFNIKAIYFIPILFAVIPAVFGYYFGYRGKRLSDRLMFVKPNDKKRRNLR